MIAPWHPQDEPLDDKIQDIINEWLKDKLARTSSQATTTAYQGVIQRLRSDLRRVGLDLNGKREDITPFIREWVATPKKRSRKELTPATRKQRLAIIASFYRFAVLHEHLEMNPTDRLKFPKVQEYANAEPIDIRTLERLLDKIDMTEEVGVRDNALLYVAFTTGRRASELANLKLGDVVEESDTLRLYFRHTKGGKAISDPLEPLAALALIQWLSLWYGQDWQQEDPEAAVWVRLQGERGQRGTQLRYPGVRQVFIRRLGSHYTKVHTSRHSFSLYFLQNGGSILELMSRLGHASLDTTYRYSRHLLDGRDGKRTRIGLGEPKEDTTGK